MLSAMNVTPGQGIDFNAVGRVLLLVLVLYLLASIFMYLQGRLTTVVGAAHRATRCASRSR